MSLNYLNKKERSMKNNLTNLCLAFVFSIFSLTSIAQPKTPIVNHPQHHEEYNCDDVIQITIELTNLELFAPSGSGNLEFLPIGYPEMYIAVTIFNQTEYYEIEDFTFSHVDVETVWEYTLDFPINVCGSCDGPKGFKLELSIELVTPQDNAFVPYPICDYTGPDDIFSCEYFTQLPCNPVSNDECELLGAGTSKTTLKINCDDPDDPNNPGGSEDDGGLYKVSKNDLNQEVLLVSIAPNPISDQINIQSNKQIISITIFAMNGRLIQHIVEVDSDNLEINAQDLSSGVYIIQVKTENEIEMIRVVK